MSIITPRQKGVFKLKRMKQKTANVNNVKNMAARMSTEKKKVFIAVGLISVMAFMWVKVFLGKETATAAASITNTSVTSSAEHRNQKSAEIKYVSLEVIQGRNDRLKRDMFNVAGFEAFGLNKNPGFKGGIGNADLYGLETQIRNKLKLNVIIMGDNPAAMIENKLVSVGDMLAVNYENKIYEFVVSEIKENEVVINFEDCTVSLKMSQP